MLLEAPLTLRAYKPIAVLLLPTTLPFNAANPSDVLFVPVVLSLDAILPTAVLKPPVVLEIKALTPKTGKETFDAIQREALKAIPELKKFKYSLRQLQKIEEI